MNDNQNADYERELARAIEVMLDVVLPLVDGKDDDEIVFVNGFLRTLARELNLDTEFAEIEPMTAGTLRDRWRIAKQRLAEGTQIDGSGAAE